MYVIVEVDTDTVMAANRVAELIVLQVRGARSAYAANVVIPPRSTMGRAGEGERFARRSSITYTKPRTAEERFKRATGEGRRYMAS